MRHTDFTLVAAGLYVLRPPDDACPACRRDAAEVVAIARSRDLTVFTPPTRERALAAAQSLLGEERAAAAHSWRAPCEADAAAEIAHLRALHASAQADLQRAREAATREAARATAADRRALALQNQLADAQVAVRLLADADPEVVVPAGVLAPRGQAPAEIAARLERFAGVARQLIRGLGGEPFAWRGVDGQHGLPIVRAMGLTLVSKTRLAALGWRLKRGAQPVGERYYEAPISRYAPVYLLEAQAVPLDAAPGTSTEGVVE